MAIKRLSKGLLKRERIRVKSEFDQVLLTFGNVHVRLDYETALLLSQWIRMGAKQSKRFAGDTSRHWSIIGKLHDANYGPDHMGG